MHQYKHYSFDLWDTLFRPNPEFKRVREKYLQDYLQQRGYFVAIGDIRDTIKDVWRQSDAISQFNGKSPNALELYALVIFRLTSTVKGLTPLEMELLYQGIEAIFLSHPPTLWDEDTEFVLRELWQVRGKTLNILSNTSFTRGRTLDKVLEKMGIKDIFVHRYYSDEHNMYKPNQEYYKKLGDNLPYETEDIIHIGDNPVTDGVGAQEYGFGSMIINSNSFTIKDLL